MIRYTPGFPIGKGVPEKAAEIVTRMATNATHLGQVPDAPAGGRAAWTTSSEKTSAVDTPGNLLLKNIVTVQPGSSGPTTTSATFADIPNMAQTITTKGNTILLLFTGTFQSNTALGGVQLQFAEDTLGVGKVMIHVPTTANQNFIVSLTHGRITPAAGLHTYSVQWAIDTAGITIAAYQTSRTFTVIELG